MEERDKPTILKHGDSNAKDTVTTSKKGERLIQFRKWWEVRRKRRDYVESVKEKVTQSSPTLCNPMDYAVHGILQARILGWVAFPFSRGSSQPRACTQVSCIAGGFFTELSGKPVKSQGGLWKTHLSQVMTDKWVLGKCSGKDSSLCAYLYLLCFG